VPTYCVDAKDTIKKGVVLSFQSLLFNVLTHEVYYKKTSTFHRSWDYD